MDNFSNIKPNQKTVYQGIKGKTLIDHRKRIKLNLDWIDYCILDYLDQLSDKTNKVKIVWNFHERIGLEEWKAQTHVSLLTDAGFLEKLNEREYVITSKWWNEFPRAEEQFELLWKLFPKGKKKAALIKYRELIKTVDPEYLYKRREAYVSWKKSNNTDFQYYMGLDVFLNDNYDNPLPSDIQGTTNNYKPQFTDSK